MNLKIIPSIFIFTGSYLPLAIILIIYDISEESINKNFCFFITNECDLPVLNHPFITLSFFSLCLLSCIFLIFYLLRKINPSDEINVISSKPIPNDLINYVLPYVVSLMGLDFSDPRKIAGFFIFFFWMFLITYRSGQILMNPIMIAFKWKIYESIILHGDEQKYVRLISKKEISDGKYYKSSLIHGLHVLIDSPKEENENQ